MARISLSSTLIGLNTPDAFRVSSRIASICIRGITIEPWLSFKNPPPANDIGPPDSVPMPSTEIRNPGYSRTRRSISTTSMVEKPSVTINISPWVTPVLLNKSSACPTARSARPPWAGIISVLRLGNNALIVATSSVKGVTTKASAA